MGLKGASPAQSSCSGLGLSTHIPGGGAVHLSFGSRHRNRIAGTIAWLLWCKTTMTSTNLGEGNLALFLFQSLKERTHPSSEHLQHFEVVILRVNNRCLWDSESESKAYRGFSLHHRKEKNLRVRHQHFHLTFIFNQGIASTTVL